MKKPMALLLGFLLSSCGGDTITQVPPETLILVEQNQIRIIRPDGEEEVIPIPSKIICVKPPPPPSGRREEG